MPWKNIEFSKREWKQIDSEISEFRHRCRFLVDQNVPEDLTLILRGRGYDTKTIGDYGFCGRDDGDVFQLARKEDRILITQDGDFLNDTRFPPQGSPGVAVLPAHSAGEDAFANAFGELLSVHGDSHDLWYEQKLSFPGDETVSIRFRDASRSRWTTVRFRFPGNGPPMVWEDE
jgi:predicted nuclease of predicted toxin-antitoxin system